MDSPIQGFFYRDFANAHIPEILYEIYLEKVYEPYLKNRNFQTIVDVGANIGLTAHYFKDYAREVFAVEPAREHVECIQKMIRLNGISNIKVLPYAMAPTIGPSFLYHHTNGTMHGLDPRLNATGDPEIIMCITFEVLFKMFGIKEIDFLKLDPEGVESELILSEGFINVCDKIKTIVGEWHVWGKLNKDEFKAQYEKIGYTFEWIQNTNAALYCARRL